MAVGGLSGAILIAAAWVPTTRRVTRLGLVLTATVPFALFAWVAIAPVLVMLMALATAWPMVSSRPPQRVHEPLDAARLPM